MPAIVPSFRRRSSKLAAHVKDTNFLSPAKQRMNRVAKRSSPPPRPPQNLVTQAIMIQNSSRPVPVLFYQEANVANASVQPGFAAANHKKAHLPYHGSTGELHIYRSNGGHHSECQTPWISPFADQIVSLLSPLWDQAGEEHLMKQAILGISSTLAIRCRLNPG